MTTSDIALPGWVAIPVYLGVCFLAVWKGEWAERIIGAAKPAAWGLSIVSNGLNFTQTRWGAISADILLLILMLFVALKSEKYWPLWIAGFQVLAVVTHVASISDPAVGAWAYATAAVIFTHLSTFALGVGVWGCIRQRAVARRMGRPAGSN